MKYEINELVMHYRDGLSSIANITDMFERKYYVIRARRNNSDTIYVPCDNSENVIRPIMTIPEADNILKELKTIEKYFEPNTKQRRDAFKRRLASGNINDIAYLYRQYALFTAYPEGVKLGPVDIDMLEYAKNMILDELAITFSIDREEIDNFIQKRINKLK